MRTMRRTIKKIEEKTGTLSKPSKMPGFGYSTPAKDCKTGSKLAKVKNSICSICYARKGRYVFPNVIAAMEKRLASIDSETWVADMVDLIGRKEKNGFFRWHDSGDVQSVAHLEKIVAIAKALPKIIFWLPTREYSFVRECFLKLGAWPENLTVRLSAFMINGNSPVSLAKSIDCVTSGVANDGNFDCVASKQGNKCLDCRACWDKNVENIGYPAH